MKIAESMLTLPGQPVSLPRSPWLPAADIGGTHDSVSSVLKTGYKAR